MTVPDIVKSNRLLAKYARLRMSGELQELIDRIPVQGMKEIQSRNSIYSGIGRISTGMVGYPVRIRVTLEAGRLAASVVSDEARIWVEGPFEDENQRLLFSECVTEAVDSVRS